VTKSAHHATVTRSCDDWAGHVIVCGLAGVGLRTVEQLHHAGVRVVVVDDHPDARLAREVRAWGVPMVLGSSRLTETLTRAGLAGAAALVCVQDDDLHTLETALLAREARAGVRIVVQMRNPAVGRALARANVSVLDVAGLSAPSVVEACLRTGAHPVELGGERFLVVRVPAPATGTLRDLYGSLAPIAVTPAAGGEVVVCPGRDHEVREGDWVSLLGTARELDESGVYRGPGARRERSQSRAARYLRYLTGPVLRTAVDRRLVFVMLGLTMLVLVASTVLRLGFKEPDGSKMTVLDSVYFTVATIGTVGFGDFSFRHQAPWLRVFAICLIVLGALFVTLFFALLTNLLVSRRIEESLGRGRLTGRYGHVVIIGLGSVGVRVAHQLIAAGGEVVIVESDESNRYLAQMRAAKVPVVIADATLPDTLQIVNLREAAAVAVLTSDDLVNLETGLAVRDQLGPHQEGVPVVLRLFDEQLAATIGRSFSIGTVRSTAALAAPWFVGAALGLDVLGTFYIEQTTMLIGGLTVAPGGGLDGLAMGELSARTRVVAIGRAAQEGQLEHPPRRGTRFQAGDRAYLVGPYEELLQVLRRDTLSPEHITGSRDQMGASADEVTGPADRVPGNVTLR
jgi:Trk K+ transport system NAD-binding subunit